MVKVLAHAAILRKLIHEFLSNIGGTASQYYLVFNFVASVLACDEEAARAICRKSVFRPKLGDSVLEVGGFDGILVKEKRKELKQEHKRQQQQPLTSKDPKPTMRNSTATLLKRKQKKNPNRRRKPNRGCQRDSVWRLILDSARS